MRWTKHLTLAHADAALGLILEEFGAEGYGVYWLMVEDIAAPMELQKNIPDAIHSEVKWAQICHCSVRVWRSIAYRMREKGLIEIESIANRRQITIRNILKYKDEYLKKSEGRERAEREQRESRDQRGGTPDKTTAKVKGKTPGVIPLPQPTDGDMQEVVEGYNRHLKHDRWEPQDAVMKEVLSMNGRFDWAKFRRLHQAYCDHYVTHGWDYCKLTFLAWINAGMPPSPSAKPEKPYGCPVCRVEPCECFARQIAKEEARAQNSGRPV